MSAAQRRGCSKPAAKGSGEPGRCENKGKRPWRKREAEKQQGSPRLLRKEIERSGDSLGARGRAGSAAAEQQSQRGGTASTRGSGRRDAGWRTQGTKGKREPTGAGKWRLCELPRFPKLSWISAPSTALLPPGAADTTRRLVGRPRDNATAVPAPREQGLCHACTHWAAFQAGCPPCPGHCPHAYRQGGCSAVDYHASKKDGAQVPVMLYGGHQCGRTERGQKLLGRVSMGAEKKLRCQPCLSLKPTLKAQQKAWAFHTTEEQHCRARLLHTGGESQPRDF